MSNLIATGVIQKVYINQGKPEVAFELSDGNRYSCFNKSSFEAGEGHNVTFQYKQNQGANGMVYNNVTGKVNADPNHNGIVPLQSVPAGTATQPPLQQQVANELAPKLPRDRCIIRQSSMKTAAEIVLAVYDAQDATAAAEEIIRISRTLEDYCTGDLDFREAEEELASATAVTGTDG